MNKKIMALVLATAFIFMLFPISVFAKSTEYDNAYTAICEGIKNLEKRIDIFAYNLKSSDISPLMQDIRDNEPMFYYLDLKYKVFKNTLGDVTAIEPIYSYTPEEIKKMNEFVSNEINAIIATLPEDLDDFEKALYFHDYICVNYEYDVEGTGYYDLYNMLYYKRGVCQAYTGLYDELLLRNGIETCTVSSDALGHIWNQVRLGGKWYHVDVTWDDPLTDTFAKAKHEYFLQSDSASAATHKTEDFVAKYKSDTSFDNMSWHENAISFAFSGGETYFIDNGIIKSVELTTDKTVDVYTIDAVWRVSASNYYPNQNFSGLCNVGDKLVFNTDKEILYYNPLTGESGKAALVELGSENIYRLLVRDNKAYYMHSVEYSLNGKVDVSELNFVLDDNGGEKPSDNGGLGDVNDDGTVTADDYIVLKRACFGLFTLSDLAKKRADVDYNGLVDANDYILLKRAFFGMYKIY